MTVAPVSPTTTDPGPAAQPATDSPYRPGGGTGIDGRPAYVVDASLDSIGGPPLDVRNPALAVGDDLVVDSKITDSSWAILALHAAALDDVERARIAAENRARALRLDFGLEGSPQEAALLALAEALAGAEKIADRQLRKALRACPLGPWVKATVGIGERQGARLLAAIGDPAWHPVHERPRKLRELYAYCGLNVIPAVLVTDVSPQGFGGGDTSRSGDPLATRAAAFRTAADHLTPGYAPRPKRGERMNWSHEARMRAWLIAQSIIKCGGPFRPVYDAGREKYAEAVHLAPCGGCSPAGQPAAEQGTPLRPIHQHQRAVRLVMKAVLKQAWRESRALHGWTEEDPWAAAEEGQV